MKISLKLVLKGPINNIPALVQIMVWHRPGDKPLSEPMMVEKAMELLQSCITQQYVHDKDHMTPLDIYQTIY